MMSNPGFCPYFSEGCSVLGRGGGEYCMLIATMLVVVLMVVIVTVVVIA